MTIAARDAKLAVLEWDAGSSALRPSSLHYFEGDPGLEGPAHGVCAAAGCQD